jgi:heme exporter protein D
VSALAEFGGRYAIFVWSAYAVSAAVFAWMIIDTLALVSRQRRKARRLEGEHRP